MLGKNNQSSFCPGIYYINTTSESKANAIYASLMPQLSIKVNRHTAMKLDVDLGLHRFDYEGNTVAYGDVDHLEKHMDVSNKKDIDLMTTISYYPWVTILNTMMLHNNTASTQNTYSK